jgi:hypothetical protein
MKPLRFNHNVVKILKVYLTGAMLLGKRCGIAVVEFALGVNQSDFGGETQDSATNIPACGRKAILPEVHQLRISCFLQIILKMV